MKTDIKYSLASVAALLVSLGSCTTVRVEPDEVVSRGDEILFIAGSTEPGTRAMLDAGSFRQVGNALKIFDIYSPTATWATAEFYIRDANAVCNSTATGSVWPFYKELDVASGQEHYYWTKMGSHRFYGVANKMAGNTIPEDWKFNNNNEYKVFSVPATFNTYNTDKEQFDLIYSNIAERNLNTGAGTGPVELQFRHLFAGYAFTLKNDSPNPLKITSVRLKVGNSCTATINYGLAWDPANTGSPEIEYASMVMNPADGIPGAAVEGGAGVTIASGSTVNLMIPGKTYTDASFPVEDYRLIWPQQLDITNAAKGPGEGGAEGESLGAKVLEIKYEKDVTTTAIVDYEHYDWTDGTGQYYVTFEYVGPGKGDYTQTTTQYNTYSNSSSSWYKDYKYIFAGKNKGSYKAVNASTSYSYNKKYIKTPTIEESTTVQVSKTININLANITKDKLWNAGNRYLYNLVYSNDAIGAQVTVMNWEGDKGGDVTFE